MPIATLQTIPILRIFDESKAREFYIDFLGFRVDWEHRFDAEAPLYMQVSSGTCLLHLSGHHGDACPGSTVFLRVAGLDAFHAELLAKRYGPMRPGIEPGPGGARTMEIIDPFGNRLRYHEDPPPADRNA